MRTLNHTLMWVVLSGAVVLVSACDAAPGPSDGQSEPNADAAAPEMADDVDGREMPDVKTSAVDSSVVEKTQPGPYIQSALAVLRPAAGHDVHGTVRFKTTAGSGLKVIANVSGLSAGMHAYHVHKYGDCTAPDGSSAGPHYAFRPGVRDEPGKPERILGNLGELDAGADGHVSVTSTVENARLNGPRSIIGRAVVVHEMDNNPDMPPAGGAGSRIACGVIGIASPGGGSF